MMGPVGNNHRAEAGDKDDRRQGIGKHDDRLLDDISNVGKFPDIRQIPGLNHEQAETGDNTKLRQNHERGNLEDKLFTA